MSGQATLHPQCREVLRHVEAWGAVDTMTVAQARALDERRLAELAGSGPEMASVRELQLPGADGPIGARAYRPTADVAPGVLVWLHGGGWVLGSVAGADAQTRALAHASGCVVLSVDYRLAPEHRFPSGLKDALAAVEWAAAHAQELGARSGRLAVGGDSAGGNLAAAVTLLRRDRGGPRIDFQLLVYPVTCRDLDVPSRELYAEGYWLTQAGMTWCWNHYLGDEGDADSPYVSPLWAESLVGLPPALVVLAECDVLHDEGEAYARRLAQDGVPVEVRRHAGMLHGFIGCAGVVEQASQALREAGEAVQVALTAPAAVGDQPADSAGGSTMSPRNRDF